MMYPLLVFGLVIVAVGLFGLAQPVRMRALIGRVTFTNPLRYLAAALRVAVAAMFYLVADETDFPTTLRILAGFSLLSGVAVLWLNRETLQAWLQRATQWPSAAFRGISIVALALGAFLVVAAK